MPAKTAVAAKRVATADVEPTYEALLTQLRQLFATDVETRFKMAALLSKMLQHRSADEVAEDTDMTPGGVARIAAVADFWGSVRIAPDGKRRAPWYVYDRVALDTIMTDQQKQAIKQAATRGGLKAVRELIRSSRTISVQRVNEVVNGKRAAKTTTPRSGRVSRGNKKVTVVDSTDGIVFVDRVMANLNEVVRNLDELESLSEEDAMLIRNRINDVVAHVVRLTKVD